jgi:hypothetical protein
MGLDEQHDRNAVNAEWVKSRTTSQWAAHVLTNLSAVTKKSRYQALGLGFSYRYVVRCGVALVGWMCCP